ncbi:MAG: alpha/beta fold hydrolase, partial [Cyanobacteriota bacterium]|nr:alpha/beta fold hydrolase [Cyanobacteriota bacterium]
MQTAVIADSPSIPGTYWQWREQSIYYVKAGRKHDHRPPLLLVHGFGASTDHWRKNIAELQEDFEVWAIDLLGFGRSAKPNIEYSSSLWRAQLYDFITEFIGQPTVIAGNSLGGYAALCVAAEHPEAVAGIVLLNSAGPFSEDRETAKDTSFKQSVNRFLRSILLHPWASFLLFQYTRQRSTIRKTLEKVYLDRAAVSDRLVEEIYRPSCDQGAAQVFASIFRSPRGETNDMLLGRLQCPLLVLWGEGDPWINARERGAKFRKYYP